MPNSKIKLTMQIKQDEDHFETTYETDATFHKKDDTFFLFFDEVSEDDLEITKCRFEITDQSLRLRRNGPIVIDQTHIENQETKGYIKTPFGYVDTRLKTSKLSFNKQLSGSYRLELNYDLYTGLEHTGNYFLTIMIT